MWNKIKIVAALVCLIAVVGTGSGWLARGRNAVEASLLAAEPPVKREPLPKKAPDPADKVEKDVAKTRDLLAELAVKEDGTQTKFSEEEIEARLNLAARQDEMRLQEQEWNLEREQEQERLNAAAEEISHREKEIHILEKTMDPKTKGYNERRERFINAKASAVKKLDEERRSFLQRERGRKATIREFRKRVFEAEYELRRIESRHAQVREVLAVKRQALLARLEQLEGLFVGVEPADRLHDVERKLDVLRRELGELRRALEQKKSE